jgi:hypothetical protein
MGAGAAAAAAAAAAASTATSAARAGTRGLLRSFVERQVQAVNSGDAVALGSLLRGAAASWRCPPLALADAESAAVATAAAGAPSLSSSLQAWSGQLREARILPTQILIDESQRAAAVEWVLRYRLALPHDESDGVLPPRGATAAAAPGLHNEVRQLLGGTTFVLNDADEIEAWHSYSDGARAHQVVSADPMLEFSDLDPSLSPWRPRRTTTTPTQQRSNNSSNNTPSSSNSGGRHSSSSSSSSSSSDSGEVVDSATRRSLQLARAARRQRASVVSLLHREAELWSMTDVPASVSRPYFDKVFAEDAKLINPWTVRI